MLPKRNRLKNKKEIERVLRRGRRFKGDLLVLKILPNSQNKLRFAFLVPRRLSKKAVLRNRIKRVLREIVRMRKEKLRKGFDGVFLALPGLETKGFAEIVKEVERIFKKSKLLK